MADHEHHERPRHTEQGSEQHDFNDDRVHRVDSGPAPGQTNEGVSPTADAVTASLPRDSRARHKYTQAFAASRWHEANYMIRYRLHHTAGLALFPELVSERAGQVRKVERKAGVEQPPRQHPLPG